MSYIQRKFYLPEDLYNQLSLLAKGKGKNITQMLREILQEGLIQISKKNESQTGKELLMIADRAEKEQWGSTEDLAKNHDTYFIDSYEQKK